MLTVSLLSVPLLGWTREYSLVRVVLQDQLLQPQERPLVRDLLPNLHTCLPGVLRRQSGTSRTLSSVHDERKLKRLLQDRVRQDLLLDRDLELDTPRVRLSPDEGSVNQADLHQWSSNLLQADSW